MSIELRIINLLPQERREALRRNALLQAFRRVLNVCWLGVMVLALVGVASALGLRMLSWSASDVSKEELSDNLAAYVDLRQMIDRSNIFLAELDMISSQKLIWSDFLSVMVAEIPDDVSLSLIELTTDGGPAVSLTGTAKTRSVLVILEDKLGSFPGVAGLQAPRSNLLHRENAQFTFTLMLEDSIMNLP